MNGRITPIVATSDPNFRLLRAATTSPRASRSRQSNSTWRSRWRSAFTTGARRWPFYQLTPTTPPPEAPNSFKEIVPSPADSARAERASDARITPIVVQASHSLAANHLRARTQAAEALRTNRHFLSSEPGKPKSRDETWRSHSLADRHRKPSPAAAARSSLSPVQLSGAC